MRSLALTAALLLAGCASAPAEVATAPAPPPAHPPASAPADAAKPPVALQYLYGSPEAAVAVRATNARIADYGLWRIKARPKYSVTREWSRSAGRASSRHRADDSSGPSQVSCANRHDHAPPAVTSPALFNRAFIVKVNRFLRF